MPRRAIVDVRVEDVQKRRVPNKHYVYIIQVTWSNGSTEVIYRRYSRFFNLQMQLLDTFPVEGGQKDPKQRYIPFLPGKILFKRSHIRDVAVKRLKPIDEYCRALIRLPAHISQCDEVLQFFETRPEDLNPPKEEPIGKKKSGGDGTSADQFFLDQYVAVTNYEKQESTEIGLRQGQVVEVIEKNESGWWFVSSADEQGWVPATCLEAQDGAQDDLLVVSAKPGEEENFAVIYSYSARDNDEIDLERGMVVQVIQKNLEGWWKIRYQGREGWAPASYLKKATNELLDQKLTSGQAIHSSATDLDAIGSQPSSAKDTKEKATLFDQKGAKLEFRGAGPSDSKGKLPSLRHRPPPRRDLTLPRGLNLPKPPAPPEVEEEYYTIAAFQTTIPDGISFQAGEKVEVIEKNLSGWWYIQINAEEGWAPASFIDKYKKTSNALRANFLPPLAHELAKLKLSDGASGSSTNGGESTFPTRPLPKEPQASNHNDAVEPLTHPKLKDWRTKDISKSPPSANVSSVSPDGESQPKPCPSSSTPTADVPKLNKEKSLFPLKKEQVSGKLEAEPSEKHSKGFPPKPPVPGSNLPILPPKLGPGKGDKKSGAEPKPKGLEAGPKISVSEVTRPHLKPVARPPAKSKSDLEDKSMEQPPNLGLKPRPLLRPKPLPATKGDVQPDSELDISNLRSKLRRPKAVDKVGEQEPGQPPAGNQNSSNNLPALACSGSPGNTDNSLHQMKQSSGTSCKGSDATKAFQKEQNGHEHEPNGPSVGQEKVGGSKNNVALSKPFEKKADDTQLKKTPSFNRECPPRPQVPPRRPALPKKTSGESAVQPKDTVESKPAWGIGKPAIPPPRPKHGTPHDHGNDDLKPRVGPRDALAIKGALFPKSHEHKRDSVTPPKEGPKLPEKSDQGKEKVHFAPVNLGEESSKQNLYVALADFVGDEETAGFKEGSIFELFEKNTNGWWYCKILNPEPTWEGWVPSNYLTRKC